MEIKLLSCPLCLFPHFKDVDTLRATLINAATTQLICPVCDENLMGLDKLTIHLFSHINKVPNGTSVMPEKSPREQPIVDDINENEIIVNDNIAINLAPATNISNIFETISSCEETPINNLLVCDICNFTFNDRNILELHQKLLHQTTPDKKTGIYSYHCHLCSKKFKMRGSLMVHLRVAHYGFSVDGHSKSSEPNKEDDKDKHDGAKSLQTKVFDNKQWECDICTKMFTTKYFLKKHKRLHTGEMPYCCTQCNKSFTFQQSYHKHMLYHSSEKPHTCNECGRSFKELSTLQNHSRIHSGERPFACENCGKRFRQRVSYLVHRRIHTGVMPYKCTACDKTFRYKVSQRSHKCTSNIPGGVIKIPEGPGKIEENSDQQIHCMVSLDQNGIIRIVQKPNSMVFLNSSKEQPESVNSMITNEFEKGDIMVTKVEDPHDDKSKKENGDEVLRPSTSSDSDLYSMILSPLLPGVESLCLTTIENENTFDINQNLPTIAEETLKQLFS